MTDQLVRQHIRAILQYENDHTQRYEAVLKAHEAKGYRIVSGGQTGPETWYVTDERTGELIMKGAGGYEGYSKAAEEYGENWAHVDPITEHLFDIPDPVTPGLPESLCEVLASWVRDQASDEDIDQVLGEG